MNGRLIFLGLLLVCVAADARSTGVPREPNCNPFFPGCRGYNPVCGSNGRTYANECMMCLDSEEGNMDVRIVKDGTC